MKCITALFSVFGILASSGVIAQSPFQRLDVVSGDYSDLPAQTAANGPEFGFSVAVSGEWMAVGAPATVLDSNDGPQRKGVVFMFRNQGDEWILTQRIRPPNAFGEVPRCGHSVGLSGSHLIVGCPDATGNLVSSLEAGRAYLYRRKANDEWQFQEVLFGSAGAHCGFAVDIVSNPISQTTPVLAVIGCPGSAGTGRAIVLAYDGNEWNQGTVIFANDGASGDAFGSSVALLWRCISLGGSPLCTRRVAVGAPNKAHGSAILGGAAYVFEGGSLTETDIFTHVSPTSFGATFFGTSVDINNSQLLVGSSGAFTTECGTAPRCGRTMRWERSGSSWNSTVGGGAVNLGGTPPGEQVGMQFGRSVALGFDNWIAIGAPMTDGPAGLIGTYEGLGLVELRRKSNGDWGNGWGDSRAELRPESFPFILNYDDTRFGTSVAFGEERWLAVGVPRWPEIRFPGPVQVRRGQVWMYAEPDGVFSDRFEQ